MTIKEKAKAYDEALERAREWFNSEEPDSWTCIVESIFPELKESEEKRIKDRLIKLIKMSSEVGGFALHKQEADEMIAWLEKQGNKEEPQVYKTKDGEVITYSESEGYKVVEPKFKVGDWVVCEVTGSVYQIKNCIENLSNHEYGYDLTNGDYIGSDDVNHYHLWTIKDANDGDVLLFDGYYNSIVLFQGIGINGEGYINYHCKCDLGNYSFGIHGNVAYLGTIEKNAEQYHPATKEQHDFLFEKMKEAGYEWDIEKKELKKIEQEPENYKQQVMSEITDLVKEYISRQKPTWSEDDDAYKLFIISAVEDYYDEKNPLRKDLVNWLKALKQRIEE